MPSAREVEFDLPHPAAASGDNTNNQHLPKSPCAVGNYGQSHTAVIVTHPWGPLGGNRHNSVVVAACLYFQRLGVTTCRFDFLPHQWLLNAGVAQVEQVKQVAALLLRGHSELDRALLPESATDQYIRPTKLILLGYSYGSFITGSAGLDIPQVVATISIAPPFAVGMWLLSFRSDHFLERAAQRNDIYRLYVLGDEDNFTSEAYFQSTLERKVPSHNSEAAILKGADHFFRHREKDLMSVVGQWLKRVFPECEGDLERLSTLHLTHAPPP